MDYLDTLDQTTNSGAPIPNPPEGNTVLASFFFSLRGAKTETSNTQMLQSLLYQILYQQRWLYHFFRDTYRALRPKAESRETMAAWNFEAMYTVFQTLARVRLPDQPLEIYLLVDALDESEKEERDRVLVLFQDIGHKKTPPTSCVIKCVLASRPDDDIKSSIMKYGVSRLIPEDENNGDTKSNNMENAICHLILEKKNEPDIKTVIEVKLKLLRKVARDDGFDETQSAAARPQDAKLDELLNFVASYLESNARGVFMWVEIATRELARHFGKGYTSKGVKKVLKEYPVELVPFYKRIVDDQLARFKKSTTGEKSLQEARRMLTWTTFAERPLSGAEFRDAFAIPESAEGILIDDFMGSRLGNNKAAELKMADVCGDLVEIRHDIVQLLHLTVREFLLRDQSAAELSMEVAQGEFDISLACIRYLEVVFTELSVPPYWNPYSCVEFLSKWHLLYYILRFLPRHLRGTSNCGKEAWKAGGEFADAISRKEDSPASQILEAWFVKAGLRQYSSRHSGNRGFLLQCISEAGQGKLLDTAFALLETATVETPEAGVDDEDVDKRYGEILFEVSRIGVRELIVPLLEMGADPNYKGRNGDTPLLAASKEGHIDIVALLVKRGADVNFSGPSGTALLAASAGGHKYIVELLLEHGADVNFSGSSGTALLAASAGGHTYIAHLLILRGADVNFSGSSGTALLAASTRGHSDIVKLLLRNGADINAQGPDGTPLLTAAAAGYEDIVDKPALL
jgi:ankyrin repeat protein